MCQTSLKELKTDLKTEQKKQMFEQEGAMGAQR
jgi:hypothetical protein